jgi:signal peptidase I
LRHRDNFFREVVDLITLVGAIYALVNLATVRFVVQGPSMEPNFETGQFLIVSRLNYLFGAPERGDIVVFHFPGNTQEDYIKRVIGLPGDTIRIDSTRVYVNDVELEEPYINEPCAPSYCRDEAWELGTDEYFVLGDNRNHSSDSRSPSVGTVKKEFMVGEAVIRYWPLPELGSVAQIAYSQD